MRVLIFGGNRFVGRRVAARLAGSGAEVTLVHRSRPSVPKVTTICGDRCDPAVLEAALSWRPDAILDMSLYTGVAARALMERLSGVAVRYVGVSSAAIYAQSAPVPWTEASPVSPAPGWGEYGAGKAEADAVVARTDLADGLVVRPVYVIGSGDPDRRCDLLFSRAARGLPVAVPGEGASIVQVLDADDMAEILIRLLLGQVEGVLDLPGAAVSVRGFTERCVSLAGGDGELRTVRAESQRYLPERWPFPDLNLWVEGRRFREECSGEVRALDDVLSKAFGEWAAGR